MNRHESGRSVARTIATFKRRSALWTKKGRPRHYLTTPVGRKVTEDHFGPPLADFIRGDLDLKPNKPPARLSQLLYSLDAETLATIGLASLLDGWARGWDWEEQSLTSVCLDVGRHFEAHIDKDLSDEDLVLAGHWLVDCATTMSYFDYDEAGFPIVAPDWRPHIDACRKSLLQRHPVDLPHEFEPPPWTRLRQRFPGRMPASFVRDWRRETREAVEQAFKRPDWEHARAASALGRVQLEVDPVIVDLVGRFAVKINNRGWKRIEGEDGKKYWLDQWAADYWLVNADLAEADVMLGQRCFYLTYSTDKRGRIYSLQHLNYGREDHVRAMLRFHKGMRLGEDGLYWLAVHVANCHGETDKEPWQVRVDWVASHLSMIERIAADPAATFDLWCGESVPGLWPGVDKPFAFVAACREYIAAKADPENFETHLPVSFDHTCSGIQHLAMICRDENAAALVNLLPADRPQDVYMEVARKLTARVNESNGEFADWWKSVFARLGDRDIRKLMKPPVMTYGYAATKNSRQQQIAEVYYKFRFNDEVPKGVFGYLAAEAEEVIEELLPIPASFMRWIKAFAAYHATRGNVLAWHSPTHFPVRNAYHFKKGRQVGLRRGGICRSHGRNRPEKNNTIGGGEFCAFTRRQPLGPCRQCGHRPG
jgi:hypothetical protein